MVNKWKIRLKVFLGLGLLGGMLLPFSAARADHPQPVPLEEVRYEQKLNEQLPLDLEFIDEAGQPVRLEQYFGSKPVLLILAYYNCPMLCPLVLDDFTQSLKTLSFTPGREFEIITVSIDPREGPQLASEKKAHYIQELDRPTAQDGWHFLTGTQASIDALSHSVGFHAVYDEHQDQYAHPAGVITLTPQGRISRYLAGIDFPPLDLRLGLVEASANKIGSKVDQFFLLCYHYDPVTGRYSLIIENVLRLAGVASVLVLAGGILWMLKRERQGPGRFDPGTPASSSGS